MLPETTYHIFKKLEEDQFTLMYMGEFDDDLTPSLMRVNETGVEPKAFRNRLSFLIAECFQNIIRHADKPHIVNRTNNKPKMILVRNIDNTFYITSTNLIDNQKKAGLTVKLNGINKLSQNELKEAYMDSIANTEFSSKGGAGLGFIEMARRSGSPIEFDFDFVNYFFSVFYTQFSISSSVADKKSDTVSISNARKLYNELLDENILMIRKGDFSQKSILPLFEMIENILKNEKNTKGIKKIILYFLMEMLQNISKHGALHNGVHEGIILIALKNNRYVISAGNFINTQEVDSLKDKLDELVKSDQEGLAEAYKNKLLAENKQGESAGMGLIEISKYSSEKLKYSFKPVNGTLTFFSLSITV